MELQSNNSKFFSYIIILASLFFVVFITKNIFATTQQYLDTKSQFQSKITKAEEELSQLNTLKTQLENNQDPTSKESTRFAIEYDSKSIFEYIYAYADAVNSGGTGETIIMRWLSVGEWNLSDLGMKEAVVNVSARFSSQKTFLKFLNYITSSEAKYSFFIESLSYPTFGVDGGFQISIPLKIYYK